MILQAEDQATRRQKANMPADVHWRLLQEAEKKRRSLFPSRLHRSADAYLVRRGRGKTIIAGYPWFTDWGRDTFIALRGLCLVTGRLDDARDILLDWAGAVSEGMLPNRFPDRGEIPEYNSVDASLWYIIIAVHDFLQATASAGINVEPGTHRSLQQAVEAILTGYSAGTRFGIRPDDDGLLAAGVPGVQLTWMDAKVGDWVVTPRIGKPVEVQALWLNALWIGGQFSSKWLPLSREAGRRFGHASGTRRMGICTMSLIQTIGRRPPMPPFGPTRSSPSAACPSPCWKANRPAAWSMPWKPTSGRRWDFARSRRASPRRRPSP